MSSIGPPPKAAPRSPQGATSRAQAEALGITQQDDARAQQRTATQGSADKADVRLTGSVGPEGGHSHDTDLHPPEPHLDGAEDGAHNPKAMRAASQQTTSAHLEHAMHVFEHEGRGMPRLPPGESRDAAAFGPPAHHIDAARQRSLQAGQHGFVIPLTLRRPRRIAYTETPEHDAGEDFDVAAIAGLAGSLKISLAGGMHTRDNPGLRKERRFQQWLRLLARRRRLRGRRPSGL